MKYFFNFTYLKKKQTVSKGADHLESISKKRMETEIMATPQHKKLTKRKIVTRAIFITIGAILMAIGLELFLVPNKVVDGGITGISIMLSYKTGISLGVFIFLLNIPFFFLGYKNMGKTFSISTLYGISILSISIFLLHGAPIVTHDVLLASIFGGFILGIGVGLVIRYGGSLDGTEILAILFNKRLPFSVGEIIMFLNIFILGTAGFVYSWDRAMYSLLTYFVAFKTIDIIILGLNESKSVWIISKQHKEIGEALMARLGRGVTYLSGEGAFSGDDKKVIFCVITRLEEAKLKSIVEELDKQAFLAVGTIAEVKGGTIKKKSIH